MSAVEVPTEGSNIILERYLKVLKEVNESKMKRLPETKHEVFIIAVSKTKPASMIIEAYNAGIRHFGENYVNELFEKSTDNQIVELCPDIKWHFIGPLQSNKVNKILDCPNLFMIHTIHSMKLADTLNRSLANRLTNIPLQVLIQVNTSEEPNKSGVKSPEVDALAKHIMDNCPELKLTGLMTIGHINHDLSDGPNSDFKLLASVKDHLLNTLDLDSIELSMGMSSDYQHAIELGSSYVRIGEKIFGPRGGAEPNLI